jgi:putative copper resistance protein D
MMASETLLAADWFGLMGRPWGESAIADQQRGGAIAWGIGEIPTLSLAIIVAVSWATSDERAARRRDRQVEQYGDAELEEYNRQLAQLAQSDARQAERDN